MQVHRVLPTNDVTIYVPNHDPFLLRAVESEWPEVPGAVAHYLWGVLVDGRPAFAPGPSPAVEPAPQPKPKKKESEK